MVSEYDFLIDCFSKFLHSVLIAIKESLGDLPCFALDDSLQRCQYLRYLATVHRANVLPYQIQVYVSS